jgi:hypothetical protein
MSDIVKGVLAGGWSLVVGWILPAALNLVLLWFLVLPQLGGDQAHWLRSSLPQQGVALLVAAVILGLLLAALQTPLYRLLEGYAGWHPREAGQPERWLRSPLSTALGRSRDWQLRRKQVLLGRLDLIELSDLERTGTLRDELRARLAEVRADRRLDRYAKADAQRGASQLGLLREQVRRYPVDDGQVVPTRLGNAIRRLEEYGYQRFRLDSQTLWYELTAVAPEEARNQVDQARTTVDFLVCLLYGHLLVAACALAGLATGGHRPVLLLAVAVASVLASAAWYRVAVVATDDWAAAVRGLVNLGRKPLCDALGLGMPATLDTERAMWSTVSRLSARPYDSRSALGDQYRTGSSGHPTESHD